jgi:hypothetical protein
MKNSFIFTLLAALFLAFFAPAVSYAAEREILKKPRSLWSSKPEYSNSDVAQGKSKSKASRGKKMKSQSATPRTCPRKR